MLKSDSGSATRFFFLWVLLCATPGLPLACAPDFSDCAITRTCKRVATGGSGAEAAGANSMATMAGASQSAQGGTQTGGNSTGATTGGTASGGGTGILPDKALCTQDAQCGSGACVTCYSDSDADTFGDPAVSTKNCDSCPAGRVTNGLDCNDASLSINPGAAELPGDGIDQNCDGKELCYVDADKDGFRTTAIVESPDTKCEATAGEALSAAELDCLDSNASLTSCPLSAGGMNTCSLTIGGKVRCWGEGLDGKLGYGNTNNIGDNETPASVGDIGFVAGGAIQVATGGRSTCVLLTGGNVRCWGFSPGNVDTSGQVTQISMGLNFMCELRIGGKVRCWNNAGTTPPPTLGYGNTTDVTTPTADIDLGGVATQISVGRWHACALLVGGSVRCWGGSGYGALGYPNIISIGDDETPAAAGPVNVGGTVIQIAAGYRHTCALLSDRTVRCWGQGSAGALGYGNTSTIGDDEAPASVGVVNVGGRVSKIAVDGYHTCVLLEGGTVRCWGSATPLGYGNTTAVGTSTTPADAGDLDLGGPATDIVAGYWHSCARLKGGAVRCWGESSYGQLGYGNTNSFGDNETPASVGDVPLY